MISFSFCKITFIGLAEKCTWKNRQSTNKAFESNWRNVVQQSSNRGCLDSMRPSYNECRFWWKYNSRVRYVWGKTSSIFISWIYYLFKRRLWSYDLKLIHYNIVSGNSWASWRSHSRTISAWKEEQKFEKQQQFKDDRIQWSFSSFWHYSCCSRSRRWEA